MVVFLNEKYILNNVFSFSMDSTSGSLKQSEPTSPQSKFDQHDRPTSPNKIRNALNSLQAGDYFKKYYTSLVNCHNFVKTKTYDMDLRISLSNYKFSSCRKYHKKILQIHISLYDFSLFCSEWLPIVILCGYHSNFVSVYKNV